MKIRWIARKAAAAVEMSHIFVAYLHFARGCYVVLKTCASFLVDVPKPEVMNEAILSMLGRYHHL